MCIRYNIEFWTPIKSEVADWERKVKRGIARPGQNRDARLINFYECNGAFNKYARCAPHSTTQGGCYRNRIQDYCYEDDDCFLRLMELQSACTVARRDAQEAERDRLRPEMQEELTGVWQRAYDDWNSAYEHHRECPWRRYESALFRELKRADCVVDRPVMRDSQRLGAHPGSEPEPVVGIQRHYDAPFRRY